MNPYLVFSAAPLAVLGAVLVATGWFGWVSRSGYSRWY